MILQALNEYYQRKQTSPDAADHLPAFGLEEKPIPFIIVLDEAGALVTIADTREKQGKKEIAQSFLVPKGVKKSVNIEANLLWGTAEYVLGLPRAGAKSTQVTRVAQQHQAFIQRIKDLPEPLQKDAGLRAILHFLTTLDLSSLRSQTAWEYIKNKNPLLSFRLNSDAELISQRLRLTESDEEKEGTSKGLCLVTGTMDVIERLHPAILGVKDKPGSQAAKNIVSFNRQAFNSYGKEQGGNAGISRKAAFAYTTSLNHLLRFGSRQRVDLGDASTVFWAAKPHDLETMVPDLFGDPPTDEPHRGTEALQKLMLSAKTGKFTKGESSDQLHVLGLSPNAARISIRFWDTASARDIARRIEQHFDDINVVRSKNDPEHLSLSRILTSISALGKTDNIPPSVSGDIMRSIIEGIPYPATLLNLAVQRCRADQAKRDKQAYRNVPMARAAVIKACLNRTIRRNNQSSTEPETFFTPMLDPNNPNRAYRLGRLFATLEKVQEEANQLDKLNATIRDKYYGAASSTPGAVFSTLIRLNKHHLSKLGKENKGLSVVREKLIQEIANGLDDFPAHLTMPDQGRFALGYYHQRQALFTKAEKPTEPSNN